MIKKKKGPISPVIDKKSYIEAGKMFELFMNKNQKKKNG